jgi:hypothetical protein
MNSWTATFIDPTNPNSTRQVKNATIPANTIEVYVGGAALAGPELGEGGKGGYSASGSAAWLNLVAARGQTGALATPPTDFGPWGGAIAFDTAANWSFGGPATPPGPQQFDFYSVALHELSHVLGIGTAPSWRTYVDGTSQTFSGPHAEAVYGGPVPIDPAQEHWADGTLSDASLTVMNPSLGAGVERSYTPLDWAGLADVGWSVDRLVVTAPASADVAADSGFGLSVAAEDPDGTIDTTFSGPITLALGNQPAGASLGGTLTATAAGGVATFTGLTLNQPGSGYTLEATSGNLPAATAGPINVSAGTITATQLVVTTEPPASLRAGNTFGLVVSAEDAQGNVDANFSGTVTLALAGQADGAVLGGTLTVSAFDGAAAFAGLTLDRAAAGATLTASSVGLSPATTNPISVVVAPSTQNQNPSGQSQNPGGSDPVQLTSVGPGPVLTPDTAPVPATTTVVGVSLQGAISIASKHKPQSVIVVQFSAALNPASAVNLGAYSLSTIAQGKKHPSRAVPLGQATYDPVTLTVTLTLPKKLAFKPPLQLRLNASLLIDAVGRRLDGSGDGQPGGDFVATLTQKNL